MVTSVAFSPVSMLDETKPYAKKSFSPWAAKRPVENAGELVLQSLFSSESKKKKHIATVYSQFFPTGISATLDRVIHNCQHRVLGNKTPLESIQFK